MGNIKQDLISGSIHTKANLYFGGQVISHTILDNGNKKTVGVIFPGKYTFNTSAPEEMIITTGSCRVLIGNGCLRFCEAGMAFQVPANSSFTISVDREICEYVCVMGE